MSLCILGLYPFSSRYLFLPPPLPQFAVKRSHTEAARVLLESGADFQVRPAMYTGGGGQGIDNRYIPMGRGRDNTIEARVPNPWTITCYGHTPTSRRC